MSRVGQRESLATQAPVDREDEEEGKDMGRHRRIAAGRAATSRATGGIRPQRSSSGGDGSRNSYAGEVPRGIAPYLNPEAYADATARAHAYLFAADGEGAPGGSAGGGFTPAGAPSPDDRHRKKAGKPVRAGLLGVSAAVALGTAAVATGVVPGLQSYKLGGATHTTGGERVQAVGTPSNTAAEQGGTSGSADSRAGGAGTSRDTTRPQSPSPSAPASASASASPTPSPSRTPSGKPAPTATPSKPGSTSSPTRTATQTPKAPKAPAATSAPETVSARSAAEAEVLRLVNQERAKAGCSPLAANSALTKLAETFSDDMAARDFFDHTDPNGKSPWDRAAVAGITDLGGENIARGQADAAAVMQAWMNSPGHRANILNCDFKTLGVGVHFGPGGPWWTQDFGY